MSLTQLPDFEGFVICSRLCHGSFLGTMSLMIAFITMIMITILTMIIIIVIITISIYMLGVNIASLGVNDLGV